MKQYLINNLKRFFEVLAAVATLVFGIYSGVFAFVSWSDFGYGENKLARLLVLILTVIVVVAITALIVWLQNKNTVWTKGTGSLSIQYGDLMNIAFKSRDDNQKIVVIPVNTHFDTILDENIADVEKPLVSPSTIHGLWLKQYCRNENPKVLNQVIQGYLEKTEKHYTIDSSREPGNQKKFSIGEIAIVKGENGVTFFLLAISDFDANNNARSSAENIQKALRSLLEFYDKSGNVCPMYLPLMGTGCSRTGLSHKDSLNLIKHTFMLNKHLIHQKINVVVWDNDKDNVSIWENEEN